MSFLSHRAWRMVSLVALAIYFVFLGMSSAADAVAAVVAADVDEDEEASAVPTVAGRFLLNDTGVQS